MLESRTNNLIISRGEPKLSKDQFFRKVESLVCVLDHQTYCREVEKEADSSLFPGASAFFSISMLPIGKRLADIKIYVDKEAFRIGTEDFSDLMPIFIRHEIFEMWTYAKNGWSLFPQSDDFKKRNKEFTFGHILAIREEIRYAFEIGKGERFIEFKRKWAEQKPIVREENLRNSEDTYRVAKARYERR